MSPSPPSKHFKIGWICALPLEAAAAQEMFDERFGVLDKQDRADPNIYTLGRIGNHYVVVACIGGQYGTTSAAVVASHMMRTFSDSLRIGLMVGIGGGIPTDANDMRLGDIVISYPTGICAGVIQHDMGKVSTSGRLIRTGMLNSPPRILLAAVNKLRADIFTKDPHYPSYMEKVIQKNARTRCNFSKPEPQDDRLFQPQHRHPSCAPNCDTCPVEWEVNRYRREDSAPQLHYGIIASGNTVIKDAGIREQLLKDTGAICFDMEAAGLMIDFPSIIIRGICDYADSHKNKKWQNYAALAAASYAKELLENVPYDEMCRESLAVSITAPLKRPPDASGGATNDLEKVLNQRESHYDRNKKRKLNQDYQRCHQALKTSAYEHYKNINPLRSEGTCQWVFKSPCFSNWCQSQRDDLLWVSADPGCGKSVLARSLVDNDLIYFHQSVSICYIFFRKNNEQNNLATALCAILHQLYSLQPGLIQHAISSWDRSGSKFQAETDELWRILVASTADPSFCNTICVIDALDECQMRDQQILIEKLQSFYHQAQLTSNRRSWLKFLVTSRPYDEIKELFEGITDLSPNIRLCGEKENDRIRDEVQLVAQMRVSELARALNLGIKSKALLKDHFMQMDHRTYLWLHLVIDDIRVTFQNSLRPSIAIIQSIPSSVQQAYIGILNRVTTEQLPTAKKILQIIIGAKRPLTTQEMAVALRVSTARSCDQQMESQITLSPVLLGEKIRRLCGLFVFIQDSKIYLIHQTAREFLINSDFTTNPNGLWYMDPTSIETMMAGICAKYLLLHCLGKGKKGFLAYAAGYWSYHYRMIHLPADPQLEILVQKIYDTAGSHFALWYPLYWELEMPYESRPEMDTIHLAAFSGHFRVVQQQIRYDKSYIERKDSSGTTALQWASLRGHYELVRSLIDSGADPNTPGGKYKYRNALHAAAKGGHLKIVQVLLESRANSNTPANYGSALYAASESGYHEVVEILLDNGADVDTHFDGTFGSALTVASYGGYYETVRVLLQRKADVNLEGGAWGSALQAASLQGHIEIVQTLLAEGANVNAGGGGHGSALQGASSEGHLQVVEILLNGGADINAQSGFPGLSRTALHAASSEGHLGIVKLLLTNGADVNAKSEYQDTALQAACRHDNYEIVEVLLENGVDINGLSIALKDSLARGHTLITQLLLKYGASLEI